VIVGSLLWTTRIQVLPAHIYIEPVTFNVNVKQNALEQYHYSLSIILLNSCVNRYEIFDFNLHQAARSHRTRLKLICPIKKSQKKNTNFRQKLRVRNISMLRFNYLSTINSIRPQ
jgi:hypothetical protein